MRVKEKVELMNLNPLNNNIYCELIEETEVKTSGGLFLTYDKEETVVQTAVVLAIGSTVNYVKVGEKIVFNKHSFTKIIDNFVVIKEDNVFGIVE